MEKLKNRTILVGKDTNSNRLLISMVVNGEIKAAPMGEENVPNCVSRCKPAENVAHCKIEIDGNGDMMITNLKDPNVTYVDGSVVIARSVNFDSKIELGCNKYPIYLRPIIETAKKMIQISEVPPINQGRGAKSPVQPAPEYNIYPLRAIYENYHQALLALQIKQRWLAIIKSLYLPIMAVSGIVAVAVQIFEVDDEVALIITAVFSCIAVLVLFYGLYKTFTDRTIEERERLSEEFQQEYVCPNPECNRILGNQPYAVIRQMDMCPKCKGKYVEKPDEA